MARWGRSPLRQAGKGPLVTAESEVTRPLPILVMACGRPHNARSLRPLGHPGCDGSESAVKGRAGAGGMADFARLAEMVSALMLATMGR